MNTTRASIFSASDPQYGFYDFPEPTVEEKLQIHASMGIVAFLSVAGIIGNALVLYVFSRQKQKLSSTIFILTLAGTDFVTSLVTMPYTIVVELLYNNVRYDFFCKLYNFLITTTVPYSAFVMVAIAVDRYLCIVHPFKHTMTLRRAKIIVILLAAFAFLLGLICSLLYGVYSIRKYPLISNITTDDYNVTMAHFVDLTVNITANITGWYTEIEYTGVCQRNEIIIKESVFKVWQKVYSAFFAICALIVIILYAIIYRSVLSRRRKRLKLSNRCCGCWTPTSSAEHEQTEFTTLKQDKREEHLNGANENSRADSFKEESKNGRSRHDDKDKDALMKHSGVSKAKLEKLRMANIKTAFMLSIVALVFILAFLPAWLIAHKIVDVNVIVFYLYFVYNVANPVIYAFMNQNFRNQLKTLFECK